MTNDLSEKIFKGAVALTACTFAATGTHLIESDLWPVLFPVLNSLSTNVASQLGLEAFMPYITKNWINHPEKAVNHHIQRALYSAISTALSEIEEECLNWDEIKPEDFKRLQTFFTVLLNRSEQEYIEATRDELGSAEVLDYVYRPDEITRHLSNRFIIRLDSDTNEYYLTEKFIEYFPTRFAEKTQFHFRELLKKGDEAKQALDLLFFDTLNAGLENLNANQKEIRELLDTVLQTNSKSLEKLEFYGEIWIGAIRRNRDQLDRIEKATSEILHRLANSHLEIVELKELVQSLLRQRLQPGLINSNQFKKLIYEVIEAQSVFEAAQKTLDKKLIKLAASEKLIAQNSTEEVQLLLEDAQQDVADARQVVISADVSRQEKKQELKDFLQTLLAIQQQIMVSNSHRAIEARRLFELGDFSAANKVLDTDELQHDKEYLLQQQVIIRHQREQLAQDFILKAKLTILSKESNWYLLAYRFFKEAVETYEQAESHFEMANFLTTYNQHREAIQHYGKILQLTNDVTQSTSTLNNLGVLYGKTGRFGLAESAYQEALQLRRQLAADAPQAYLPDVASTLHNLGALYRSTGRFELAESSLLEALQLQRQLATDAPQAYLPDVAGTLNNLGVLYRDTSRFELAESAYKEVLQLYRQLATDAPQAYLPDVAGTLNNLGALYRSTSRFELAKSSLLETSQLYRQLATDAPQAYLPYVASTLNNLGILYRDTGRFGLAESAYQEALQLQRQLATDAPQAYLPDVAGTLNNLGVLYRDTGRFELTESSLLEALQLYRQLATDAPQAYLPDVASALNSLSSLFEYTDRFELAESHLQEALQILRQLITDAPQAYLPYAAGTLNNLGILYEKTGRFSLAESAYQEALQLRRQLATDAPQAYLPDVASTLHNLGALYRDISRFELAESAYQEALLIYRQLANVDPDIYAKLAAKIALNISSFYQESNRDLSIEYALIALYYSIPYVDKSPSSLKIAQSTIEACDHLGINWHERLLKRFPDLSETDEF